MRRHYKNKYAWKYSLAHGYSLEQSTWCDLSRSITGCLQVLTKNSPLHIKLFLTVFIHRSRPRFHDTVTSCTVPLKRLVLTWRQLNNWPFYITLHDKTYTNPRMSEGLCGSDAAGWVDGQHTVDEVLGFSSNRVPLRRWILTTHTDQSRATDSAV